MEYNPVLTVDEFRSARDQADSIWSDYEVFEEERSEAPLRQIVLEIVEGQYTHPQGPDSIYGMTGSADDRVWDIVFHNGLVPDELPEDVRNRFSRELGESVREYSEKLYKQVKQEVDPEEESVSISEVNTVLEQYAEDIVPETY